MKKSAAVLFAFLCLTLSAFAQREKPATESELAEITARGKMLAEYDQEAWHSTDAVLALSPKEGSFEIYVGKKNGNIWTVGYGKLNEKKDKFLITYEAVQQAAPKDFKVETFSKPKEDAGFFLMAAKAIETAKAEFVPAERRPYNVAVLPAKDEQFYVYFMPAQTKVGVFPIGGDVRFLVSKDGTKLVEIRQLHKSIIEFQVPSGIKPDTGYHTAILDEIPELVVTQKFVYRIETDGTIRYLMTTEAFKKVGK